MEPGTAKRAGVAAAVVGVATALALLLAEVVVAWIRPSYIVTRDIFGRTLLVETHKSYTLIGNCRDFIPGYAGRELMYGEFDYRYRMDGDSLRVDETVVETPPAQTGGVLLLGDSQTFGVGLSYDETFARQAERRLQEAGRGVSVYNGGVPGFGTGDCLCKLRRLAPKLKPKLTVVVFFGNNTLVPSMGSDLVANAQYAPFDSLPKAESAPSQARFPWLTESSHLYSLLSSTLRRSKGQRSYLEEVAAYRREQGDSVELSQAWERTFEMLSEAAGVAAANGGRLWVAYLPDLESLQLGDRSAEAALRRGPVPMVSFYDVLAQRWKGKARDLVFMDGHYNTASAQAIGAHLAEAIQNEL